MNQYNLLIEVGSRLGMIVAGSKSGHQEHENLLKVARFLGIDPDGEPAWDKPKPLDTSPVILRKKWDFSKGSEG